MTSSSSRPLQDECVQHLCKKVWFVGTYLNKKTNKSREILSFFTNVYFLHHVLSLDVVESVKEQMTQTEENESFLFLVVSFMIMIA